MGMKKRVILNMIKGLPAPIGIVLVTILIISAGVYYVLKKERESAEPIKTQPKPPLVTTVTKIEPASGPVAGGTPVTITGTNLKSGATVTIGKQPAIDVVFHSPTQLTAKTPPGGAGLADVTVTNPGEKPATLKAGFTYIPPPIVTAIRPPEGRTAGGEPITIVGVNFKTGATVEIGGKAATDVTFISDQEIRAKTPAGQAGVADVVIRNPDRQSGTLPNRFTYIAATQRAPEPDLYWTLTFKDVDEQAGDSITVSWIGKEKEPTIRKEGKRWEFEIPIDALRVKVRWTKGGKQGGGEFANNLDAQYNTYFLQRLAGSAQSTEQKSP